MTNTNAKKLPKIDKTTKFTASPSSSLVESYARQGDDLILKLTGGSTYVYRNVDVKTFDDFVKASSKGKFFGAHIKNKFTAELVA